MCTALLIGWHPATPLSPRIETRKRGAIKVSKDRRHLFVTPCTVPIPGYELEHTVMHLHSIRRVRGMGFSILLSDNSNPWLSGWVRQHFSCAAEQRNRHYWQRRLQWDIRLVSMVPSSDVFHTNKTWLFYPSLLRKLENFHPEIDLNGNLRYIYRIPLYSQFSYTNVKTKLESLKMASRSEFSYFKSSIW